MTCSRCDGLGWIEIETQTRIGEEVLTDVFKTDCFHCRGTGDERNMPRWMACNSLTLEQQTDGVGVSAAPTALGRAEAPQPPSRLRPAGAIANARIAR